jgi:hypothetical protein
MSLLETLKLSDTSPRSDASPIGRFRRRLISAIETQIEIAKADAAGRPVNLTRKRRVKDEATGRTEVKDAPIPVRRWWWRDVSGVMHMSIKSAGKTLELAPGKPSIEIGPIEELPNKLAVILEAVRAGELDRFAAAKTEPRRPQKPSSATAAQNSAAPRKAAEKR